MKRSISMIGILFGCFSQSVVAQEREMILPVPQSAYSQAVKVKGGTTVFLSGVGPVDEKGGLQAPGDYRGQVLRPGKICGASWPRPEVRWTIS
jgi:hypothetical protein